MNGDRDMQEQYQDGIDPNAISPRVVPGLYSVILVRRRTQLIYGRPKLVLVGRISDGEHKGVEIPKYYGVSSLKGPPGVNGAALFSPKGDFVRDYYRLFGRPPRNDRISPIRFMGQTLEAEIRDVVTDHRGRGIHEDLWYSVIDNFERPLAVDSVVD